MKKSLAALTAISALISGSIAFIRRYRPQTEGAVSLPGLTGQVEIIRDHWGAPHVYAANEADLFFAQGYVHAQDRFWQMELQRRAGAGRLSEMLGEATLEIDRHFRVLGLYRAAEAEAAVLSGETKGALDAYAAGINACMAQQWGRLALEFTLLRHEPEPWRPVDSLAWAKVMAANLGGNWLGELARARLAGKLGADLAADLNPVYPAGNPAIVRGVGLAEDAETPPNGWGSDALREALQLVAGLFQGEAAPSRSSGPLPGFSLTSGASNQWVVDGSRSATGRPLLANDTHMGVSIPATWYQIHLVGGRYNVAGVSLPGTPGVLVGHNEHCAWGLTTAWQDAQDLYIERFNPDNPRQYEFEGRWLDVEVVQEEIHVKGRAEPLVEEVLVTRHGPVISKLVGEEQPLALRWMALEPSDLLGSALALDRATNWQEFRLALADWSTPAHNFVYADVEGNIGYLQAGWMPVRAKGYGLAPVPGWTGEYEWTRYLTLDELPQAFNPAEGWLASANNLVVGGAYPHFLRADLENPCRAERIANLLASQETFSVTDFARFQLDTYSAQAERFVAHLLPIQPTNQREADALDALRAWDFRMDADSVAASIYQLCRLQALHEVFDPHLGELSGSYIGLGLTAVDEISFFYHGRSFIRLLDMLDRPGDVTWLRDPASGIPRFKTEVLHRALRRALKLLRADLGQDMATWTWGRLNRIHFEHPVGSVKPLDKIFNRGPYPLAGDHDTLFRATGAPSYPFKPVQVVDALRFIADVSDWERCRIMIPGGQSGHVTSRHYADRIPLWREGRLLPMPFGRKAVERQAAERLVLRNS